MTTRILFGLILLLFGGIAAAQDSLTLSDGRKLRGEILSEIEGQIRFVTRDADLVEFAASLVTERKEGRSLPKEIASRIEGAEEDIDQLLAAAAWASEFKKFAQESDRLYRRIVALDPDEKVARSALGHIKLGGIWYSDEKEGLRAWAKVLSEEGYVKFKNGFVLKTQLADLRRDNFSFMLDEERRWRPIEELMNERGMTPWNGEWYHKVNDGIILGELKALKEALGIEAQAFRHRGNEVYLVGSRFQAEKLAKKLTDARWWLRRNFDQREDSYLDDPRAQFFCLANRKQYQDFLNNYGKKHGRDADKVKFCMELTGMSFKRLSRVTDQEQIAWDHSLVSGLVAACSRYLAPEGVEIPAAFWVAAAMQAEETVMGDVKVHFVAASKYDVSEGPGEGFKDLSSALKDLSELKIRRKTRPMAELLRIDVNSLLPAHELQGYFFLSFLMNTKKEEFLAFWLAEPTSQENIEARFHRCMKADMSQLESEFWAWFERLPR